MKSSGFFHLQRSIFSTEDLVGSFVYSLQQRDFSLPARMNYQYCFLFFFWKYKVVIEYTFGQMQT